MNYEQMNNNRVFLTGKIITEPRFSHETFGEAFYEIDMEVERLSHNVDIIPITISEKLMTGDLTKIGSMVSIKGQFRSYNKSDEQKSHLMLTVFVREIQEAQKDMPTNIIEMTGFICKAPIYRTTPFKREICDVLIAVNRAYNKSDYLPCIAWGRNARFIKDAAVGDKVNLVGRIQSRVYQKKFEDGTIEDRTAYEVSVGRISLDNIISEEVQDEPVA